MMAETVAGIGIGGVGTVLHKRYTVFLQISLDLLPL
jgi:hypothetical protein